MCIDPATLSLVVGLAGSAVSAVGAIAAGNQQAQLAEAQAKAIEQQREADAKASAFEQLQERRKQNLLMANARAQVGASGVGFSGSPAAVLTANAGQNQLDIEAIQYGSALRQNNLSTQAKITRFQGQQARQAGYINAASSFLDGLRSVKFGNSAFA